MAQGVPLELFAFIGSFIEELIAPIPSPLVMTMAGSIAEAQNKALLYLLVIAIISSVAKTAAGYILYFLADKAEDVVLLKFGKFLGVSHKTVEKIGKHLSEGWKSDLTLLLIRSIPVMPSSPISVVCGVIKIKTKVFILTTFFGSIARSMFFLYLGYAGLAASEELMQGIDSLESLMKIILVVLLGVVLIWAYQKRSKHLS